LGRRIVRKGRSRCCRGPYNASWALVAGSTLATTLFWIILTLGSRISAGPGS
jgi:prepilin signal peptidase PulO-like enzyme (type II secretory pathway)